MLASPFTHVYASPIWLAVRLYLGYMWWMMGVQKIGAGFLTGDPIGPILKLGADGTLAVPLEFFRPIASMLVASGLTPLISFSMPFLEMAVALAFVSGVLVVPAAIGATLLNIIFVLSGIGQIQLDGRFIALQLLMIAAFRVVSYIGIQRYVVRILRSTLIKLRRPRTAEQAA
jgi:thiosulfate dehydrogenase [quinone] large subunit